MKSIKNKIKYFIVTAMILSPSLASAEMRSNSYVINENVNHVFNGPIISAINHSVSGLNVTVSFNTDVVADAFVIYSTDSGFADSMEQGTSVKSGTGHSISLSGLVANTTYYYRVRSTRINGGITTDMTARSFVTGADSAEVPEAPEVPVSGGGGVIIIDKTDKTAPVISNVQVKTIDESSLSISWDTDEETTSFGEYGENVQYGSIDGQWDKVVNHVVILKNLKPESKYHVRAVSSDSWGNVGYGEDQIVNTLAGKVAEDTVLPVATTTIDEQVDVQKMINESVLTGVTQKIKDFFARVFPQVNINNQTNISDIQTIDQLTSFIPAPVLSGEPRVEIGSDNVSVFWTTDSNSTSQVAIASDDEYRSRKGNLYVQVVGDVQVLSRDHNVRIFGLKPNTVYHYQLRSKSSFGPMVLSRDFTFRTLNEDIKITSFLTQIKDAQMAAIKWVTNKPADSAIQYAPYHNNVIALDEAKTIRSNETGLIHEIEIKEFQAGVYYDIEIISTDLKGNVARQKIDRFSTQENDLPPEISHIKTDSTVYIDKNNKTQTVISWLTNEPTNAQIFFQEGVYGAGSKLNESTEINTNFTKEHVFVITKFKPGAVYSFQIKAIDSGGNEVFSKIHTFMTVKNKESIIQVIIKILEDTFGWAKKLM